MEPNSKNFLAVNDELKKLKFLNKEKGISLNVTTLHNFIETALQKKKEAGEILHIPRGFSLQRLSGLLKKGEPIDFTSPQREVVFHIVVAYLEKFHGFNQSGDKDILAIDHHFYHSYAVFRNIARWQDVETKKKLSGKYAVYRRHIHKKNKFVLSVLEVSLHNSGVLTTKSYVPMLDDSKKIIYGMHHKGYMWILGDGRFMWIDYENNSGLAREAILKHHYSINPDFFPSMRGTIQGRLDGFVDIRSVYLIRINSDSFQRISDRYTDDGYEINELQELQLDIGHQGFIDAEDINNNNIVINEIPNNSHLLG